ncbi:hypothetical protein EIP86_007532 [Pleurotus ostreatoroseus]|nr:hypothetical protein EIP86_007532 [Pleurotus ostreatoroseus]
MTITSKYSFKYLSELYTNAFPPASKFSVDQIPDLSGQVILITGGNTGIGKETAKTLLTRNAKVYIACRNQEKMETAIADIELETGKRACSLQLDLASLKSIKKAAAEFRTKETKLHVLYNNAGIMQPPIEMMTADGYDVQFGTNVLGHFYFTQQLMPLLLSTAKTTPSGKVRVINVSSMGHLGVSHIDYDTLRENTKRAKLGPWKLYFQSKFGNVVYSNELHRRYHDQGIVSISLHPGNLRTELWQYQSFVERYLTNMALYPSTMGALTQLYAGTMPEAAELGGKYLIPWARLGESLQETQDEKEMIKLWDWLEDQIKNVN